LNDKKYGLKKFRNKTLQAVLLLNRFYFAQNFSNKNINVVVSELLHST